MWHVSRGMIFAGAGRGAGRGGAWVVQSMFRLAKVLIAAKMQFRRKIYSANPYAEEAGTESIR